MDQTLRQTLKEALEEWAKGSIDDVSDDNLIELSIIVNRELVHRELAL